MMCFLKSCSESCVKSGSGHGEWWGYIRVEDCSSSSGPNHEGIDVIIDAGKLSVEMPDCYSPEDEILSMGYYTNGLLHAFVVITTDNGFYCFDKHDRGVSLRFSKESKETLVTFFGGEERPKPVKEVYTSTYPLDVQKYRMKHVIEWLERKNALNKTELTRGYHIVSDNCRDFAIRLFTRVCSKKDDFWFYWKVIVFGKGVFDCSLSGSCRMFSFSPCFVKEKLDEEK